MVRIGKYEAYITIDGRRLPEFDIEVDRAAKEAVCWIPSEAGKNFVVEYENHAPLPLQSIPPNTKRCVDVCLDGGNLAAGVMIERPDDEDNVENATIDRLEVEHGAYRKFFFANVNVVDNKTTTDVDIQHLGEIWVVVTDVEETGDFYNPNVPGTSSGARRNERKNDKTIPLPKVQEKVTKQIGHCTQLGELIPAERPKDVGFFHTVPKAELAVFIFRYRPLAILQASGIAPLDDPPHLQARQQSSEAKPEVKKGTWRRLCAQVKVEDDQVTVKPEEKPSTSRVKVEEGAIEGPKLTDHQRARSSKRKKRSVELNVKRAVDAKRVKIEEDDADVKPTM